MRSVFAVLFSVVLILVARINIASGSYAPVQTLESTFYYLNAPESVTVPGELASFVAPPHQRIRVFFHYINHTHRTQLFRLETDGAVSSGKVAYGVSFDPGRAGVYAARAFLYLAPHKVASQLVVSKLLLQNETIDGLVEGTLSSSVGCRIECCMGVGKGRCPSSHVRCVSFLDEDIHVDVLTSAPSVVKIGGAGAGHISGDYGIMIHVHVCNASGESRILVVRLSPRGGPLCFVYGFSGVARQTRTIAAYSTPVIFTAIVHSRQDVVIDVLPPGGYCFPAQLRFSLQPLMS